MNRPNPLTFNEFSIRPVSRDIFGASFFYEAPVMIRDKIYTVCMEPCLKGFDVGIYSSDDNLIFHKDCTKTIPGSDFSDRAKVRAILLANRFVNNIYYGYKKNMVQ